MSITMQTGPNAARPALASLAVRLFTLCYGSIAYLIFFGTFLYAVGFVSRLVVPKTVDSGSASSLMTALLVNLVLMSIFAVQHSGMARQGFKKLFAHFASPAIERWTYVLLASLCADIAVLAVAADADGGLAHRRPCSRRRRNRRRLPGLAHRALQHLPDQPFRAVRLDPGGPAFRRARGEPNKSRRRACIA